MADDSLSLKQIRQRIGWDKARLRTAIEDLEVVVGRMEDEEASLTRIIDAVPQDPPPVDPPQPDPEPEPPGPDPEPPPSDGSHPNEPAGLSVVMDPPMVKASRNGGSIAPGVDMWEVDWWTEYPDDGPFDGPYLEARTPRGEGGSNPNGHKAPVILTESLHHGKRELYVSMWLRPALDYPINPADQKLLLLWTGTENNRGNRLTLSLRPNKKLHFNGIDIGGRFTNLEPPSWAPAIDVGEWNHVELHARTSGEVRVWMDGSLALTTDDWTPDVSSFGIKLEFNPLYGGGGILDRDQVLDVGEFYVSGR